MSRNGVTISELTPEGQGGSDLQRPIGSLRGIGPARADQLGEMGIFTVQDLLELAPSRHEDRRHFPSMAAVEPDQWVTLKGVITSAQTRFFRGRMSQFECRVEDDTGGVLCRWWNMPFLKQHYQPGKSLYLYGQLKPGNPLRMDHPETEWFEPEQSDDPIHVDRLVPVYRCQKGIRPRWIRSLIHQTLRKHAQGITDPYPMAASHGFVSQKEALEHLHFPGTMEDNLAARKRLALNEALAVQQEVSQRRLAFESQIRCLPKQIGKDWVKPFLEHLPFALTQDQVSTVKAIESDLNKAHPMRRLLQGDVGTGKTLVALVAALRVMGWGQSVLFMVPTTLLARQHHQTITRYLHSMGIPVRLHLSGTHTGEHEDEGIPGITVGTHALLHQPAPNRGCGLIIIDEQHKFGVAQRRKLTEGHQQAHLLVMTATPIPRTLGLALFADLDISIMRHAPCGRGQLKTYLREEKHRDKIEAFIEKALQDGRQAFMIYPRIESASSNDEGKSLLSARSRIESRFKGYRIGVMHGKLSESECLEAMAAFHSGRLDILLATSMVEVGIDVPNATIMLIEEASHFGLAQLHQMRGRVARGKENAHCILMGHAKQSESWERLQLLVKHHDGFLIAEEDFRLRGPGNWNGAEQSGMKHWKFLTLPEDEPLLERARIWTQSWAAQGD